MCIRMFSVYLFQANRLLDIKVKRKLYFYTQSKEGVVVEVTTETDLLTLSSAALFISDKVSL